MLIGLLAAWIAVGGLSTPRLLFAAGATLPLWLLLPALTRGHRRSYAAMSLCVVPYLVVALTELVANPAARPWASVMLSLSFTLFVLLVAYLRLTRPPAA